MVMQASWPSQLSAEIQEAWDELECLWELKEGDPGYSSQAGDDRGSWDCSARQDEAGLGRQLDWRVTCCCSSFPSTDWCCNYPTVMDQHVHSWDRSTVGNASILLKSNWAPLYYLYSDKTLYEFHILYLFFSFFLPFFLLFLSSLLCFSPVAQKTEYIQLL